MVATSAAGPVLVAVEEPEHVRQLVRTAGDLARLGAGAVRVVTVVAKPHDSPFGVFDDETIRSEYAGDSHALLARATAPAEVTVERDVVVARSVAGGILSAVEESDPTALVVGWQGHPLRTDAVLGTTVDRLIERADCDLYVERIGREANGVESVLLPVAGGPHVGAAATAAGAIADRNDARVLVLSVASGEADRTEATAFVEEAREALAAVPGVDPPVETTVRETAAGGVTDAVVAATADHDVIVLGATRQGSLRRRLVGSIPGRVVERTDRTVIVARDEAAVGGLRHRFGELLRR